LKECFDGHTNDLERNKSPYCTKKVIRREEKIMVLEEKCAVIICKDPEEKKIIIPFQWLSREEKRMKRMMHH
jgi:hypothetical protein